MRMASPNSSALTPYGRGTAASGPTASIRPLESIRIAPRSMGGASIGSNQRAARRRALLSARIGRWAGSSHDASGSTTGSGSSAGWLLMGRTCSGRWLRGDRPRCRLRTAASHYTAHRAERGVHRTEGGRLGTRYEGFDVVHVLGTERRSLVAGGLVNVERRQPRWARPGGGRRSPLIHFPHHGSPSGCREHTTLGVGLDLLRLVKSNPDAGDHFGREPDKPDIVAVVGSSGLSTRREVDARSH